MVKPQEVTYTDEQRELAQRLDEIMTRAGTACPRARRKTEDGSGQVVPDQVSRFERSRTLV